MSNPPGKPPESAPLPPTQPASPAPPVVALPKGGGAIRGIDEKFTANPVTGSASFSVQVFTSPGRDAFGPHLELTYDSGAGNGPFGFGWSLSVPAITRRTDKGLPRYLDAEDSDVFLLAGAEDLVPVYRQDPDGSWVAAHPGHVRDPATSWVRDSVGRLVVHEDERDGHRVRRYRPRVEGLFARIERWTRVGASGDVHWRSIARDNVLTIYGADAESRVADPLDPGRIFTWLLCESRDDKGNTVVYRYRAEDGEGVDLRQAHERNRGAPDDPRRTANRYLKRIQYGNRTLPPHPDPDWMFEVVFDYGEHDEDAPGPRDTGAWTRRPDPFSTYRAGFEVRATRRCRRVLMFHTFPGEADVGRDCLVRSTDLTYADDGAYSVLTAVAQTGYRRGDGGYQARSLPPVEFTYTKAVVHDEVCDVGPESLANLPMGRYGGYRWTDLHGEGIPGILTEQAGRWFYKRNLSPVAETPPDGPQRAPARFAASETVARRPSLGLRDGAELVDLAGDGHPDLVVMAGATPGLFEHDDAEGWLPFRPFTSRLNRDLSDPNLRLADLDGDGHADVLITGEAGHTWHASLAEEGFGAARHVERAPDEEEGPRVVFGDGTQSVHLADLSGDGLTDLVRIRNGEVCFWPNLGYGRFGAKVTMDNAPWFDQPDRFDQRRIRLADIDGSGTADLVYLHRDGPRLYFNRSGNAWSPPRPLTGFPRIGDPAGVETVDLLGNGTTCLVWSSPLPGDARRPMRYVNLMGEHKPHLLVGSVNNLGAETRVEYAPSTADYLRDRSAGRQWATRLPFPVHVVARVETYDHVSRNRFVTRYAYHDGYFDGEEREFRGFGMVEQWDTGHLDAAGDVPPVHTKSWFHTGAPFGAADLGEYFREPGRTDVLLDEPALPAGLRADEAREAYRALKGGLVRREIYADDGGPRAGVPYTVSAQRATVRLVQPRGGNQHAVFDTHPSESITYHYERNPVDPRIQHALTLEVDGYCNVLKQADVGYERRLTIPVVDPQGQVRQVPNPGLAELAAGDRSKQTTTLVTYTEHRLSNAIGTAEAYRTPLRCETVTYELTGYPATGPAGRFRAGDLVEADPGAAGRLRHRFTNEVAYESSPTGTRCRRLVECRRSVYRRDDLAGLLPLGELQPLALPGEAYRLAFTPGLLAQVFRHLPGPDAVLGGQGGDQGGYLSGRALKADGRFPAGDVDDRWWIPSGLVFYTADPTDPPAYELALARERFFVPHRYRDAFGHDTHVGFDADHLLAVETRDAVGNRVTVEANDYRVLQPRLISDANRNRTEVAFDTLGLMVATAVMGKAPPAPAEGDTLAGLAVDLTQAQVDSVMDAADPYAAAPALLRGATTRLVHDVDRFRRSQRAHPGDPTRWQPSCTASLSRETHASAPLPPQGLRIQVGFSYSDGFGREIQKKVPAEPGPLIAGGSVVTPRWVADGWTVFNNKGDPVRRYEPFFSATQGFEFGVLVGVSPVVFYDPDGRVVATLYPNDTYTKVTHDAWQETTYDANDTCAPRNAQTGDPRTDPDIGGFVAAYFAGLPPGPPAPWATWYSRRIGGALGAHEQAAADRAAAHADTPTTAYVDVLGRPFLTVVRNRVVCVGHDLDGTASSDPTRVELDIEGNQLAVRDALDRVVMRSTYDLVGNLIEQVSMEGGARWTLDDATGRPIRTWDGRGHAFTSGYDALRRPVTRSVRGTVGGTTDCDPRTVNRDVLVDRTEYGEPPPTATQAELDRAQRLNLRTRVLHRFDGAGITTNASLDANGVPLEAYDFKGNQLRGTCRLAEDHTAIPDWGASPTLAVERFESGTRYDALNRPVQSVAPHSDTASAGRDVVQRVFNEANLLERVDVWLGRSAEPTGLIDPDQETPSKVGVRSIERDAKGQRLRIEYRNGTSTAYGYDPSTLRLTGLLTRREATAHPGDDPDPQVPGWPGRHLQNLRYTYDAAGNVTHVHDDAQQAVFFRNRRVEPGNDYTYDALYRLIQATGREHLGQLADGDPAPPTASDAFNAFHARHDHPGDGGVLGTYVERYLYDAAGNFTQLQHRGSDPTHPGWVRAYEYLDRSVTEPGAAGVPARIGNRLSRSTLGRDGEPPDVEPYEHDAHGNMIRMPHLGGGAPGPNLHWDYDDRLYRVDLGGGGTAYYVYDTSGYRTRKVWEKAPGLVEERVCVGDFESFRRHSGPIGVDTATLSRETLHLMDDKVRIALVETRTLGTDPAPRQLIRFQLGNHLGSASVELDERSEIISYEEHGPYGATTYQAVRMQTETPKRYRFTGKERDEESGLYSFGARYYACWLGRWTSADPAGLRDGPNRYSYVRNNPVLLVDARGEDGVIAPFLATGASVDAAAGGELAGVAGIDAFGPMGMYGGAVVALSIVSTVRYVNRTTSLVKYTNPHGMPTEDLYRPQLRDIRAQNVERWKRQQIDNPFPEPKPETAPELKRDPKKPDTRTKTKEKPPPPLLGRVYVTYTKFNIKTGLFYSGRTSMEINLRDPRGIEALAVEAMELRDLNHQVDENDEPKDPAFLPAQLDRYAVGFAADYGQRYRDVGYLAIRGREQQLIDFFGWEEAGKPPASSFHGGAQSDTAPGPDLTENSIRAVAKENPLGPLFHGTADLFFGEAPMYTGYKPGDRVQ